MLKIENLKKYFGGVRAVDNCSFEIKPNTITALIGPNGAGKSTIFNLISGISKTDSGEIIFSAKDGSASGGNSIDITNLSPDRISNLGTSRLFQKTNLFNNLTVRENLLLALDNEDTKFWKNLVGINKVTKEKEKIVRQALKEVNLEQFENTLARELSYGQKRLIELQRAILNPHQFLMLDEPVAGV
ncbi:MAG: ATP-binding cassette domain-containing protein, partial [bacterium]|nr:ATP-binding cassette domain-containing protein [bacterium]